MRRTCLDTIYNLAKKNKKVIFVGSDLGPGVLKDFKKNIPDRFFMEGVSEQFIIGMSAGLAKVRKSEKEFPHLVHLNFLPSCGLCYENRTCFDIGN